MAATSQTLVETFSHSWAAVRLSGGRENPRDTNISFRPPASADSFIVMVRLSRGLSQATIRLAISSVNRNDNNNNRELTLASLSVTAPWTSLKH